METMCINGQWTAGHAQEAIPVINPARNPYLSEALNLTAHAKLTRTLSHMHFTFAKKISHTADSQDQRHRTTPGSRPILSGHFVPDRPDVITPGLIEMTPTALELYEETVEGLWGRITRLLNMGVAEEFALYLLPNAVALRGRARILPRGVNR